MIHRLLAVIDIAAAGRASALEAPKLSFGGQIRARAETTGIDSYATAGRQRGLDTTLLRTRLGLGVDTGKSVKGYLQIQDSRTWGTEASVAANTANVDLHQGYLDALDLFGERTRVQEERLGRIEEARRLYRRGIEAASKEGDGHALAELQEALAQSERQP